MKSDNKAKRIPAIIISIVMLFSLMIPMSVSAAAAGSGDTSAYSTADATSFVFSDSGIVCTEGAYAGYKVDGTALTIKESGTYVVSGSCTNGTIVIKKNVTDVTLVLNGLTLSASATAPITCNKGSEVRIVAAAGSVNKLADDKYNNDDTYTDETLYPDIENAVIKCKDGSNVTICGTGTINITANGKNGVKGGYDLYEEDEDGNATDTLFSTASLTIKEVTLNITANVNDGLKSDKELNILSGNITVSAVDDGIKCDYVLNIGADGTTGPMITVKEANEGIEAATLNVYSGNITVNASDDGINAANSDLTNYSFSYNQYGGYVYVNVTNGDGIDSNGTINLIGGVLEIYSPAQGDGDPLDSETGTNFKGTTVLAVGHLGMAQGYSATTPYVSFGRNGGGMMGGNQTNLVTAGSTIQITDASGNVLYTAKAVRNASYVLFASPELTSGSPYTLKNNSASVATATASTASTGGMGGPGGGNPGQQPPEGMQPGGQPGQNQQPGNMQPGGQPPEGMQPDGTPGQMPHGEQENTAGNIDFWDVTENDWFYSAVKYVSEKGLMLGTGENFEPNAETNRAMLVTILYRLEGSPAVNTDNTFSDVAEDQWYTDAITWASENGIVSGYSSTAFGPLDSITREQFAAILYRYAKFKGNDTSEAADISGYSDASSVSSWANAAMKWAVAEGLITGRTSTTLAPDGNATRAETATILMRFTEDMDLSASNPSGPDGMPPEMPNGNGEQGGTPPEMPNGNGGPGGTPPGGNGGPGGNNSANIDYTGAVEITSAETQISKTYTSTTADENALLIATSDNVTITNPTVTKSGDSNGGDNCNFYGLNAAVLVKGGSTATISGGTISTSASGANGVFSYGGNGGQNEASGDGTTVIIRDTTITTTGSGSGGIMTTGGGITYAYDLDVTTSGQSSAAIRTDRGGGTVYVDGGTYTSNGLGSPAIYSTAEIHVENATLISNLSEGVCIEGLNSIELTNCDLTANNTKRNGNARFLDSIMIYQSMSGDAASGTSHFTMTGGSLTSKSGHVFHVTNTNAVITLNSVKIINEDGDNVLISVCDDGWNGGNNTATLKASKQVLKGAILVGSNSTLTLSLTDGSALEGYVDGKISNAAGATVSTNVGTVSVTLDDTSTWTLTGDSYVTEFNGNAANVISNGYTLYVNGVALTGTR